MSEMWNGVATGWERNAEYVDGHVAAATGVLLEAAQISTGAVVLDLACGPGGAGIAAAERVGPTGQVTLADVAEGMVAAAARRVADRPQFRTLHCDQTAVPLADGTFDAVISRHGLMFATDPAGAVGEAVRLLRPGGAYATMTWGPREDNPWLGLVLDAVGEQVGMTLPPPGVPGPFSLSDPEALATVLRDGGLEDVTVQAVATPAGFATVPDWWELVPQLAGPIAGLMAGMDAEARAQIRDRAVAAAQARARPDGDGGLLLDGVALVGAGRRPGG